jgi:hypothetical protein
VSIDGRRRWGLMVALAAALLAVGVLAAVVVGAEPSVVPSAVPGTVLESGDLRSEGAGPGLVGNPLLILGAVVLLGLATAAVTVVVLRLSRRG